MCDEDEKLNYVCRPGKFVLPILKEFLEKLQPTIATPPPLFREIMFQIVRKFMTKISRF